MDKGTVFIIVTACLLLSLPLYLMNLVVYIKQKKTNANDFYFPLIYLKVCL